MKKYGLESDKYISSADVSHIPRLFDRATCICENPEYVAAIKYEKAIPNLYDNIQIQQAFVK